MDNTMQKINDEDLGNVAGGYLSVSEWIRYANANIMPALRGLQGRALGSDAGIISQAMSTIMGTFIPGASVAGPILNLWDSYSSTYRRQMNDVGLSNELGVILSNAKSYISSHA